jgi:peroxiredoxin
VYHAIGKDAFNIAHPATFVVGRDGSIRWIAVSPSQYERPRLEDIFAAIEACDKY